MDTLEKWMWRISLAIFLAGGGIALAGDRLGNPFLLGAGMASMGLGTGISGLQSVITRKAEFVPWVNSYRPATTYTGLSGVLWGILFIGLGGLMVIAGLATAFLPGGWQTVLDRAVMGHLAWGLLIVGSGVVVATLGLIRVLSGTAFADPEVGTRLMDAGERIGGLVMMGLGAVLILAGLVAGLAPRAGAGLLVSWAKALLGGG
jgi:hypothetical protein